MVTKRQPKAAKKPARENSNRRRPLALEAYFNTSQEAAITLDLKGTLTYANARALDIIGYQAREVIGRHFTDLPIFTPGSLKQARALFQQNHRGKAIGPVDMELVKKDGSEVWVVMFSSTIAGPGGDLITITMNDITWHKQATAALQEERNEIKKYLDIAGTMLLALDREAKITMVNRRGCEILNGNESDFIGKDWFATFIPAEHRDRLRKTFDRLMAGETVPFEHVAPHPVFTLDGKERIIVWHNSLIRDDDGAVMGTLGSGEDITERLAMEKALQETRELDTILLDNAPNQVMLFNPDMSIKYVNPSWTELNGWTNEEIIGMKPPFPWWPKAQRKSLTEGFHEVFGTGPASGEVSSVKRSGETYWLALSWTPRDDDGAVMGTLGSGEDITERLAMEKALQETREFDKILLDNAPNQVMMFNPDMSVRYVNPTWVKLNGWTSEQAVGMKPPFPWWPDSERDTNMKMFIEDFNSDAGNREVSAMKKNGEVYWLNVNWTPVKKDGKLLYWLLNASDITGLKLAEQALRESEERFRKLIGSSADGIVSVNKRMEITLWNEAAGTILGYPESDMLGHSLLKIVPDSARKMVHAAFQRFLATGQLSGNVLEVSGRRKDGTEVPIELSISAAERNGEPEITAILRDITQRREAATALTESEERFAKAFNSNPAAASISAADDGTFIEINKGFTEMLGYTREETIGHTSLEMGAWADPAERWRMVAMLKEQGHVRNEEFRFRTKDGEVRTFLFSAEPLTVAGRKCLIASWFDITDRKQAAAALAESEERFAKAFDASPASVVITSVEDGRYIEVNSSFTELQGYTREEAIGRTSAELNVWANPADREQMLQLLDEHGRVRDKEVEFRVKSGDIRTFLLSSEYVTVGGTKCIISSSFDVTERKLAQAALRESQELLAKAFNASPDAVCITSVEDGTYVEVNNGYTEALGYPREDAVGHTSQELGVWAHPDDRLRMVRMLGKQGRLRNQEFEFRCKSGEVRTFLLSAEQITVSGRNCILSSSFDITERKQAEKLLKTLADSSPIGVYIAQDGMFKHVNRHLVDILDHPLDKVLATPTSDFVLPKDRGMTRKNAVAMLKGERSHPYAYRIVDQHGGTRYVMETVAPIMYQGKRAVLGNLMDVTQMEMMQDELRQHRDHLEEMVSRRTTELTSVNRRLEEELVHRQEVEAALVRAKEAAEVANEAKTEFLAHMSHEIRTPIHGMIGMINLALDCAQETERRQYLGMALSSADALQGVINDILDLSKIEAGQLEMLHDDFDLLNVVEEATEALAAVAFKKGLELTVHVAPDVPRAVNGDAGHLRQVVTNLLGNAIKFTLQGEVALRVEKVASRKKTVEVMFSVRDTGIGIAPDKQKVIFDPFSQADGSINREYGGTGLGLAISHHLVNNMKGHLWLTSEPKQGSTFYFTVTFDKQKSPPETGADQPAPEFTGHRALVVIANDTSRIITSDLLNRLGLSVTITSGSREAAARLEQEPELAHGVVIVDRQLADEDGIEAAARLRDVAPQAAFVMLLAPDTISAEYPTCLQAGLANHLVKPVRATKLTDAVRTALGMTPHQALLAGAIPVPDDGLRLRVLVAEDNATSQLVARKMLEKMGYTVSVASNGLEATELVKKNEYDLVLMDAEMPIMNGLEATRRIRKREKSTERHLPIIAMTAYAMKSDRDRCLDAGMDAYLSKPAKPNEINALVRSFFTGRDRPSVAAAVDINEAMKIFGEDMELLQEAAGIFMEQDYPEQMAVIREGLEKQDAESVRTAAHSIKGAARSLGSNSLGDAALRLEEAGRSGDLSRAADLTAEIEREAARLADYFAAGAAK